MSRSRGCSADHSAPPFWPWRTIIPADEERRTTDRDAPTDSAIGSERYERLTELREGLITRARREPFLHIIEDLQWADVASVLLLADIAAAIVNIPLLVVGTFRTGERRPVGPRM